MTMITGGLATDDRGTLRFVNNFNPSECQIKRFYQVENHAKGYIRAFHGHLIESKYVYVVRGSALFVAAEMLQDGSGLKDPGDLQKVVLTANKPSIYFIPAGYANGFKTLTDDTVVIFYSTVTMEEAVGDDYRLPYDVIPGIWAEDFR